MPNLTHPETHNWDEFSENYDYSQGMDELIEVWSDKAVSDGEWGGCPFPDINRPLVIEKSYPYQGLHGHCLQTTIKEREAEMAIREMAYYRWQAAGRPQGRDEEFWLAAEAEYNAKDEPEAEKVWFKVNDWFSRRLQSDVSIWFNKNTQKRRVVVEPINWDTRLDYTLATYVMARSWSLRAEMKAMKLLKSHVSRNQFHHYVLTGSFLEKSNRSCLYYMFRKGRPTLVFSSGDRLITALCSHTTGYYKGTWAGVHVPTDDVVSHLLRMRHDEYNYWKTSNQHPPHTEMAGV